MAGLRKLEKLAVMVAIEAPSRQPRYAYAARIPWETVERIRAELERKGIEWRPMAERVEELERQARRAAEQRRAEAFRAAHEEGGE